MGLSLKLLLAGLSGCLVMLVFLTNSDPETVVGQGLFYGFSGSLFMAGVLLPYVKNQNLVSWRFAGLVLFSGVSFYCAVYAATGWSTGMWGPNLQDYVIASIIGAAIVMLAAPFLLSLRFSVKYAVVSILAAIGGGIAFGAFSELFAYSMFLSFGSWHMLMCISLHVANPSMAEDGWLASVRKPRLRVAIGLLSLIVIVPLVDDGIGALLQYRYTVRDGGIKVHEPVTAYGFRDERKKPWFNTGCSYGCANLVRDGTYSFQEYYVKDDNGRYQTIFIGDRSDPNCWVFGEKSNAPLTPTYQGAARIRDDRCVTYRLANDPTANFAVRENTETVDAIFGLFSLWKTVHRVVRIGGDKVIAEATYYEYRSRFFGDTFGSVGPWGEFIKQALPPSGGTWELPE